MSGYIINMFVMNDLRYLKNWIYKNTSAGVVDNQYKRMLEEFEQFFIYVFNYSKDGISILDLELNILGVNHAMERWYAHKKPFVGEKCYRVYHGREEPCVDCPTLESIKTQKAKIGIVTYEGPTQQATGTQKLSVFPLFDDRKNMFGIIEYVRNISERNKEKEIFENLKKRLSYQKQTLREQEVALKVLMKREERDEKKLAAHIASNMNMLITPIIENLKIKLKGSDAYDQILLLESHLDDILSPFTRKLMVQCSNLTPREVQIAALVKEGKTTKEIADLCSISTKAVDFHRMNIRKKLKLTNERMNLQSYLLEF